MNNIEYREGASFIEMDGNTTYVVKLFYRKESKTTVEDKIKKLICEEMQNNEQPPLNV